MPYSEQQVLTQLESVFGGLACVAAGRGSGAQGQTISVVLDQPIGGVRSISAECFTPCPPPHVLVVKTNTGKWYAIGSNIGTPVSQEVSQNRRSAPVQNNTSYAEVMFLLFQQDLSNPKYTPSSTYRVAGNVRVYAKFNNQRLQFLGALPVLFADIYLPDVGGDSFTYGGGAVHVAPVRPGLYVFQASASFQPPDADYVKLRVLTGLIQSGKAGFTQFWVLDRQTAPGNYALSSISIPPIDYPAEWQPYLPYLIPAPSDIGGFSFYDGPYTYYDVGSQNVRYTTLPVQRLPVYASPGIQTNWRHLLQGTSYSVSGEDVSFPHKSRGRSLSDVIRFTNADLAVLGLSPTTVIQDIWDIDEDFPVVTIAELPVRHSEIISHYVHSSTAGMNGPPDTFLRANNTFTTIQRVGGLPRR